MYYYGVMVSSANYHGKEPLTYCSQEVIELGSIVLVEVRNKTVLGYLHSQLNPPKFKTKRVLQVVHAQQLPTELIKLMDWMYEYYPAPLGQITSLVLPSYLNVKTALPSDSRPQKLVKPLNHHLSKDQQQAIKILANEQTKTAILHGDTATGKTAVYAELTKNTISKGKNTVILTPEISLTPQLANNLTAYLNQEILVIHSGMTPKQRANAWRVMSSTKSPMVIIGPRSAIFSPIRNIGLLVVDEFHDQAYKQDQAPHYQTTRVAAQLARLHKAKLILGSATPPVGDYYTFDSKKLPIVRMSEIAKKSNVKQKTKLKIIDLKDHKEFSRSPWISDQLITAISLALKHKEQSLLFLNRRGSARVTVCQVCGWQALCPRCDLPLTYHSDKFMLICHSCGHQEKSVSSCPTCGSSDIIFKGVGTKEIYDQLFKLFPDAKIGRFDGDNKKSEAFEKQYNDIRNGSLDILVGTQMLTKGLDLPLLSVVGVIIADTSLYFPDYSAEERTFQAISQVVGRVGRGHRNSTIIIQTYSKDNPAILAATNRQYEEFYSKELVERQQYDFPPFVYMLKLSTSTSKQSTSIKQSTLLAKNIIQKYGSSKLIVQGPAPAFMERVNGKYRWQIVVKSRDRKILTDILSELPNSWSYDIDPTDLI